MNSIHFKYLRPTHCGLALSLFLAAIGSQAAGNPANGKRLSVTCAACHGSAGISSNSVWPNLAAQKRDYIAIQLKAFQSDARKNPLMSPISKILSETDIEDLAAYYSGLPASGAEGD